MGNFSTHFILDNQSAFDLEYVDRWNGIGCHWRSKPVTIIPKGQKVRQDLNDNGSYGAYGHLIYKYTVGDDDESVTVCLKFEAADPTTSENSAETYTSFDGTSWTPAHKLDPEFKKDGHPLDVTWTLKFKD
jgi:hypothetical protein